MISAAVCKWLLIGDSLAVGFRSLPDQINRAEVGRNLSGIEKTIDEDLKLCPKGTVILSVGSNDMWRFHKYGNMQPYEQGFDLLIKKITKTRKLIILPVPAQGKKWFGAAEHVNFIMSQHYPHYLYPHPQLWRHLTRDMIHLKPGGYKIWQEQINARVCQQGG